jgi:hypothetical protein
MKPDLRLAYEKADYVVGDVVFHINEFNAALEVKTTAAYITAANPHSQVKSAFENNMAHARLTELTRHYPTCPAESRDPVRQFPPEKGLLVLNIQRAEAMAIGRILEQNAIVFIERSRAPELVVL